MPVQEHRQQVSINNDICTTARIMEPASLAAGTTQQHTRDDGANDYEKQREERIKRNRQILADLDVQSHIDSLHQLNQQRKPSKAPKRRKPEAAAVVGEGIPARRSRRNPDPRTAAPDDAAEEAVGAAAVAADGGEADQDDLGLLLTQEEYFRRQGRELPAGHFVAEGFKGWVCADACSTFQIPASGEELQQQLAAPGGRRAFQVLPTEVAEAARARGWSKIQASSAAQLRSNPNAYFYRHVAPGQVQAQGEWSQEEHELFLATAKAHGVGDAWGLFASYIPQRVGYQCSAYYRDVVIPSGAVIDKRFCISCQGKAKFVGL